MSGDVLGVLAAGVAVGTVALWFQRINAVRVPRVRVAYHLAFGVAVALGAAAFAAGPGWIGSLGAGLGIVVGSIFLLLRLQSRQAATMPAVEVGQPILDFVAVDDQGKPFDLATLRGRPFLLKFFRGHW